MRPEDSPKFYPGPYTLESFEAAPPYAILRGEAADPGPVPWDTFYLDGGCELGDLERACELTGLEVEPDEPEVDMSQIDERQGFNDHHAALAFLRTGGALCKVFDNDDAEGAAATYFRLVVAK